MTFKESFLMKKPMSHLETILWASINMILLSSRSTVEASENFSALPQVCSIKRAGKALAPVAAWLKQTEGSTWSSAHCYLSNWSLSLSFSLSRSLHSTLPKNQWEKKYRW